MQNDIQYWWLIIGKVLVVAWLWTAHKYKLGNLANFTKHSVLIPHSNMEGPDVFIDEKIVLCIIVNIESNSSKGLKFVSENDMNIWQNKVFSRLIDINSDIFTVQVEVVYF